MTHGAGFLVRLRGLLFLSGAAGLIYEVVWTRLFSEVLGSTALAMTAVFSVFLGSLAFGAWLGGRLDLMGDRALAAYGRVEVAIAFVAAGASALLMAGEGWLVPLSPAPGALAPTLLFSLAASALLLGPPVLLMGATLPLAVGAVKGRKRPRSEVANLYGWNTLGAALGALSSGFVLIWKLGVTGTLGVAVAMNVVAGLGALALTRSLGPVATVDDSPEDAGRAVAVGEEALLWPVLAFISGFVVLGYEILWGRIGHFLLGDRTMAVSALLFVIIGALGVGSLVASRMAGEDGRGDASPGRSAVTAGGLLLAGGALHLAVAPVALILAAGGGSGGLLFGGGLLPRVLIFAALATPPMLVLGVVFPFLLVRAGTMDRRPGATVGRLYLVNTVGAVLGAATAVWLLSRVVGTAGGFLAVSVLAVLGGSGVVAFRTNGVRAAVVPLGATGALILAGLLFPADLARVRADEQLLDMNEDEYGVQVLTRTRSGYLRVRNNRVSLIYDLGHPQTDHAQQMAGHLTTLLAGSAERVLNVGTGYGITAGTYTLYDAVRSLETVEILPFLVERQDVFGAHNFGYTADPRVTLVQGDGRHYLNSAGTGWDIISVNVLDPYLPGSSSLYTVDFWEQAHSQLRPGGVYSQLFWGEDVALLVKGLREVFPTVLYFSAYGGTSWNVVAFRDPVGRSDTSIHFERLTPGARSQIARVEGGSPEDVLPALVRDAWDVGERLNREADREPGPVHSDERPVLEYRWAHGVEGVSILDSPLVQY